MRRDPRKVTALIYALARSNGTYVTDKTLQSDVNGRGQTLAPRTLVSYLDALQRLWIAVEQTAWGQHLRSGAQLRKAPKRHLVDPALAVAALGASPTSLVADPAARPEVVDAAAGGLLAIARRMRRPPAALAVVTATGPSYQRPDGVHVVSLLTLGP